MQHPWLQQLVLALPRLYGKSVNGTNCTHTRYYILQLYCSCMCKYYFRIRRRIFESQLNKPWDYRFNGNPTKIWIYNLCTSPETIWVIASSPKQVKLAYTSSTNTKCWQAIWARTMYGRFIRPARLHRHAFPMEPCTALVSIHRKLHLGWISQRRHIVRTGY